LSFADGWTIAPNWPRSLGFRRAVLRDMADGRFAWRLSRSGDAAVAGAAFRNFAFAAGTNAKEFSVCATRWASARSIFIAARTDRLRHHHDRLHALPAVPRVLDETI